MKMTERPILFSGPMVRAILAGVKSQTRRVVKPQPANDPARHHPIAPYNNGRGGWNWVLAATGHGTRDPFACPYGAPGDRLWVRETWGRFDDDGTLVYRADAGKPGLADDFERDRHVGAPNTRWRPSIHMPRWASRITLEITGVRVERLQDISEADAKAEGIVQTHGGWGLPHGEHYHAQDPRDSYWSLWEAINGPGSVAANPWTWVLEFKRV